MVVSALGLLIVTPYARIDFALLIFPILALLEEIQNERARGRSHAHRAALMWIAPLIGLLVQLSTAWLSLLPLVVLANLMMRTRFRLT